MRSHTNAWRRRRADSVGACMGVLISYAETIVPSCGLENMYAFTTHICMEKYTP